MRHRDKEKQTAAKRPLYARFYRGLRTLPLQMEIDP